MVYIFMFDEHIFNAPACACTLEGMEMPMIMCDLYLIYVFNLEIYSSLLNWLC